MIHSIPRAGLTGNKPPFELVDTFAPGIDPGQNALQGSAGSIGSACRARGEGLDLRLGVVTRAYRRRVRRRT